MRTHGETCVTKPLATMLLKEGEGLTLSRILEGFADTKTPLQRMHWVYQYLDPYESLLYIGMTGAFLSRACQHSQRTAWIHEAASVHYELWCCRTMAADVEAEYIHRMSPKYNVRHNLARQHGQREPGCHLCVEGHHARRFAIKGDTQMVDICQACGSTTYRLGASTYECSGCNRPWPLQR